jgi:hypothetical protein
VKTKPTLVINPYVTDSGGVVIFNGPFPLAEAHRVAALCKAAPDLLKIVRAFVFISENEERDPCESNRNVKVIILRDARSVLAKLEAAHD